MCRKHQENDDDGDDDDVIFSGMVSPSDDEDMVVRIDARPIYETVDLFHPTYQPSTRSRFGSPLTTSARSKKVRLHTIHLAEDYIKNLNFTVPNIRPPVQSNASVQAQRNFFTSSLMRKMSLNSGLLVGSMVVLTALLLFLLTLLLALKQRQSSSTKWKALNDGLKTSVTQDSEKFHQHVQFEDQPGDKLYPDNHGNQTLNGSFQGHQVVKKVNSKEWYV